MKQKLANYLKLGLLFIGFFLLFQSCHDDDPHAKQDKHEHLHLHKGRIKNYGKLNAFVKKLKKKPNSVASGKSTPFEQINGFDIIYDQDMFIQEVEGAVTYSIPIHKHNQQGNTFSNLIVRFSDTETTQAFMLTYYPDDAYIQAASTNAQTPFSGSIGTEPVHYDGSLDQLKSLGIDCETITIKYCNWGEQPGNRHIGGPNCTVGYYWYENVTICADDEPVLVYQDGLGGGGSGSASSGTNTPSNHGNYADAGSSSNGSANNPVVVPNIPKTFTSLQIDGMSLQMSEWLNAFENHEFKQEMIDLLNEEDPLNRKELEAYLLIKCETSTTPWQDYSGNFKNVSSLPYTQIRHEFDATKGFTYTEYKLEDGNTILDGDFAETITNGISHTTDPLPLIFLNNKAEKRLYEIPQPYNNYPSIDLNHLWTNFWGGVQTGLRYFTPLEDVKILIDGTDFDGVAQSRAVSGISILIDNTPFGKVFKIVKKAGQAIDASVPIVRRYTTSIYKTQRKLVKQHRNAIETFDRWKKGRWGEMATDVDFINRGYEVKHVNRTTSIEYGGHQGIDHVFRNPETGQYFIVESKYKSTGNMAYTNTPGTTTTLPRQMSDEWLTHNNNLRNAVGQDLENEILNSNFIKLVSIINPDGTITYRTVDALGNVASGPGGIYNL